MGGGLDYFQWSSLLRSVSALTSYHWVYRENMRPWLVADFLILRPEQPRSLISCYGSINQYLDRLAEAYGRQGPAQRIARSTVGRLQNAKSSSYFQSGLHEFLTEFIAENNRLGEAIRPIFVLRPDPSPCASRCVTTRSIRTAGRRAPPCRRCA